MSVEKLVDTDDFLKEGPAAVAAHQPVHDRRRGRDAARRRTSPSASPTTAATKRSRRQYAAQREDRRGVARVPRPYVDVTEAEYQRAVAWRGWLDAVGSRPTRAEVCAAALADCFRDDGEILANPIGTLPMIGGRLAKATFGPQLVMTDGEALLVENIMPVGVDAPEKIGRRVEPVPRDVRRRLVGPPPRRHGREPDRQVRQPELRVHRLARAAAHAAARHARRAGQHGQRPHVVLDPEPLDPRVRARGRRRERRRLRPRRGARRRGTVPRDRARRHEPVRPRLRDA